MNYFLKFLIILFFLYSCSGKDNEEEEQDQNHRKNGGNRFAQSRPALTKCRYGERKSEKIEDDQSRQRYTGVIEPPGTGHGFIGDGVVQVWNNRHNQPDE